MKGICVAGLGMDTLVVVYGCFGISVRFVRSNLEKRNAWYMQTSAAPRMCGSCHADPIRRGRPGMHAFARLRSGGAINNKIKTPMVPAIAIILRTKMIRIEMAVMYGNDRLFASAVRKSQ